MSRKSDPDCLHCAIYDLVNDWVRERRVDPTEAIQKTAEGLGHLIGAFPRPADRRLARKEACNIVIKTSKRTSIDRVETQPIRGRAQSKE